MIPKLIGNLPEKDSTWLDFRGIPHHVTNATQHSVTANVKGHSVNKRMGEWIDEMTPLVVEEALAEVDTAEALADAKGEYWADSERNGD